jgi:serine/threonine-protein kinase
MWLSDTVLDHLCQVADAPDLSGTRYDLIEKLGQGGMASVFLVHDRELDRDVALKVVDSRGLSDDSRGRMMNEARIIARLEHPGIVPLHDVGVLADGRTYYAMKRVRGKRLDEHVGPASPPAEILRIFEQICQAVAFAHAHGVIHRDLKPQNIMVGAFGEVLVMDWGVAKVFEWSPDEAGRPMVSTEQGGTLRAGGTLNGTVLGTPGYMPPEQARGEVDLIDERTDVYALGAVLYYLLTGRVPCPAPIGDSGHAAITPPRRYSRSIPRPLQAICLKALSTERDRRYRSVQDLSADVGRSLSGSRVNAYPEGIFRTGWRLASKYRAAVVLVLAYLVMRVLLLIFGRF